MGQSCSSHLFNDGVYLLLSAALKLPLSFHSGTAKLPSFLNRLKVAVSFRIIHRRHL